MPTRRMEHGTLLLSEFLIRSQDENPLDAFLLQFDFEGDFDSVEHYYMRTRFTLHWCWPSFHQVSSKCNVWQV